MLTVHMQSLAQMLSGTYHICTLPCKHIQSPIPNIWIHAPFVDTLTHVPHAHSPAFYSMLPYWKWSVSFLTLRAGYIPHRAGLLLPSTHGGNQVPLPDTLLTCSKLEGVPSCITEWRWPRCQGRGGSLKPLCHHHLPAATPQLHTCRKGKLRHGACRIPPSLPDPQSQDQGCGTA